MLLVSEIRVDGSLVGVVLMVRGVVRVLEVSNQLEGFQKMYVQKMVNTEVCGWVQVQLKQMIGWVRDKDRQAFLSLWDSLLRVCEEEIVEVFVTSIRETMPTTTITTSTMPITLITPMDRVGYLDKYPEPWMVVRVFFPMDIPPRHNLLPLLLLL